MRRSKVKPSPWLGDSNSLSTSHRGATTCWSSQTTNHWSKSSTLDEISNTRIFRLKQRTLPWSFDIAHLPGKTNSAADATSRHPSPANEFAELRSLSRHSEMDDAESAMAASLRHETHDIIAISRERIATETASDPTMRLLLDTIQEGFPDDRCAANDDIAAFWTYRDSLNVTDGVSSCTVTVLSYRRLSVTRSFESSIPHTREYHPWSHEPDLSYSGRVLPMTYGLSDSTVTSIRARDPIASPFNPVRINIRRHF